MNRILELGAKGNPVNMSSILSELAFDISTQNFFGKSYHGHKTSVTNSTTDERKDLPTLILQVVENAMFVPGDIYPMLRKLDIGGVEAALLSLRKELDDLFTSIFEEHRNKAERKETTVATEDSDFLDVLLSLQSENTEYSLTDREIKSLLYDLMLAGTDTISAQVIWIMTDIMRHPEVLQELHKELDSVVGRGRMVEVSDLVHMKYLKAVIKECIRLHPGLPLGAPHQSMQATKVAGYHIPAGSRVFINLWAIGRDSRVWENPMDFNPGRFFSSPIDLKGQHFQLLPFGSGRRICPAMNLGIQMMQLIVAQLFHTCDFSVPQGMGPGNVDVQEEFHGASRKKIPLELLVAPRLPPHAYDLHTAC
ncbi:hypothetical protein R1sor_006549 [Riccia sorocarpa]|uniref:Cytochrome P450 n=1 Tax=Riccia sorocarpa TaxID=122646 RepID=A0ABD3HMS0_9MARC